MFNQAYTVKSVPKIPRESYYSQQTSGNQQINPTKLWINSFWKICHVMAVTYNPSNDITKRSVACFYQSLMEILPDPIIKKIMANFLSMNKQVQTTLLENKELNSFFLVHKDIKTSILKNPEDFFSTSLKDSSSLFIWTYLFHSYYSIFTGEKVENLNTLREMYNKFTISKETWGNPIWSLLHFCSLYSSSAINPYCAKCFKAFVSCLRYCLPCPKCRKNLDANLYQLNIDNYLHTNTSLFEYTVNLHNLVNKEIGKPPLTIEEAYKIYAPYNQPLIKQNTSSLWF